MMKKYYIGLMVLTLLTFGVVGFTVYQGGLAKQDKITRERAESISGDLNSYVRDKSEIPSSLASAGIKDVPASIKYEKLSDERFKFCINYESASSGYTVGAWELLWGTFMQTQYDGAYDHDDYEAESVYVNTYGKKGENCQTIKPYLESVPKDNSNSLEASYCDPTNDLYQYYREYCESVDQDDEGAEVN